jgi:hypothetical protein
MTKNFAARATRFTLSILFVAGMTSTSYGQGVKAQPTSAQRQAMTERHKKMADMHTKMAACLESEKAPAGNPTMAYDAYSANSDVASLLPCNVVVRDISTGKLSMEIIKPSALMKVLGDKNLDRLAQEADDHLEKVIAKL